jgi:hypothetical protein
MKKLIPILLIIIGLSNNSCNSKKCEPTTFDYAIKVFAFTNDPIPGTPISDKVPFIVTEANCTSASTPAQVTKTDTLFTGPNGRIDTLIKMTDFICDDISCHAELKAVLSGIKLPNRVLVGITNGDDNGYRKMSYRIQFK